jgi:hypothetical protein
MALGLGCGEGVFAPCGGSSEDRDSSCWQAGYADARDGRSPSIPLACTDDGQDEYTLGYCEGSEGE